MQRVSQDGVQANAPIWNRLEKCTLRKQKDTLRRLTVLTYRAQRANSPATMALLI